MTMEETSTEQKTQIVSKFLLASPPGEINDVLNDVRTLVGNDDCLDGILDALQTYNREQLTTVDLADVGPVIISDFARVKDQPDRYHDPRSRKTFKLDHIQLKVDEVEDLEVDEEKDILRASIDKAIKAYVDDHYPEGVCATYVDDTHVHIAIVGNKYNPSNFWNGRWRATWSLDTQTGDLKGNTYINVHYYEDGNVQLDTSRESSATVTISEDTEAVAAAAIAHIKAADTQYHRALNIGYDDLKENAMKSLRRALPYTRNKIDWSNLANYKIGNELLNKS